MSRRKAAPKRKILPDPKYGNLKVAKFMNQIMKSGKNNTNQKDGISSTIKGLEHLQEKMLKNILLIYTIN